MSKNTLFVLAGSVVVAMVTAGSAEALTLTGSLGSGEVELFQFEATGLFEFLDVNTNGSNFDTELGLYDSSGNLIANDDDGGFGLQSSLFLADSPSLDGVLTAVVGGFNTTFGATLNDITAGSASGDYVLSLDTFDLLESTFSGSFSNGELLSFNTTPVDDLAFITVDTEGSDFDTELGLYDADGNLIANDDDGGSGLLSNITAFTSDGGNYNGSLTTVLGAFNTFYGPTVDDVTSTSSTSGNYQVNIKQYASTGGVKKAVPEHNGVLSFLAFGTIAVGSTIKRKLARPGV